MSQVVTETKLGRIERVCDIVVAYVSNNHTPVADLPALITSVHTAISGLRGNGQIAEPVEPAAEKATAAQIKESVQPDGLISFLDCRTYKTLKRHLTSYGLDPDSYRERFGLPGDYPMVAPSYSEKRSSIAKAMALGQPLRHKAEIEDAPPTPKGRKKAA